MAASGTGAMSSPAFGSLDDESSDDLPRTLRREKEARAREARERAAQERAAAPSLSTGPEARGHEPQIYRSADVNPSLDDTLVAASVRRFDVPFFDMMIFLLKVVVAAIPALILLGVIMWFMGAALKLLFPSLIKMKILISFPN